MSDTKYKETVPGTVLKPSSSADMSDPAELRREPVQRMALAQDSNIAGGRRVLMSVHTGGSHEWLVDNTATGGVSQGKPDAVTWRRVAQTRTEQAPGTALAVRVVYVPSGASEFFAAGGGTWELSGVGGQRRVVITWTNVAGDTASTTAPFTLDGEVDPDGAEQTGDGAQHAQVQFKHAMVVRPPDVANSLGEAQKFSEWVTVDLAVEDLGGARVIHTTVSEVPAQHVALHSDTDVSYTDSSATWETNRPQTEAPDGGTFEEHRYGIFHSMNVAALQSKRVGPMVGHWWVGSQRTAGVTDVEPTPSTTNSLTFSRVGPGTNATWNTNAVGLFILGTNRAPENLVSRTGGAYTTIPVLIRVWARFAAAGAHTGWVRFATTDRGWVDLVLDQATVGTTWAWHSVRGWLEASVATDDFWPILQDFFRVSDAAATLEVRYWSVSYGDDEVGA